MSNMTRWHGDGRRGEMSRRGEHPFDQMRREFDDLFNRFFSGNMAGGQSSWGMDVSEEGNDFVVRADLPGFDADDVNVNIDNDMLTIQAEEKETEKGQRSYRSYYRSLTLPRGIDPDQVQADYNNGVLELHLPKPKQQAGKRVPIGGRQKSGQQSATTSPAPPAKSGETREHAKAGSHAGKA